MDEDDELESVLSDAGFSGYEAQTYVALLQLRDASVAELDDACSVPRSRIYDVLRNLETEGYVETYEQDTLRARLANVTPVVETLRTRSDDYRDAAEALEDRWERPRLQNTDISVFQTHAATLAEAMTLVESADQVVQICASSGEIVDLRETLRSLVDRGVMVRLSMTDVPGDPDGGQSDGVPGLFPEVATEVRRCEANMPFVVLVDGSTVAFAVDDALGGEYGLVVDDNMLSSVLHWFFQLQLWEPWETLYSTSIGMPTSYVSVRELIRDLETLRADDETVSLRVKGIDTQRHEAVVIEGDLTDVRYTDVYRDRDVAFAQQFIQATIEVRTDDGTTYTVGGYGAVVEDIRAVHITIMDIE